MKVLAQKYVEKNSKRDGKKTGSKTFSKSCPKQAKRTPFYRVKKTSCWAQFSYQTDYRSTARSFGQRSYFKSLWLPVDRPADRTQVLTCQ